ncbi:MAG: hypothetical protein HRT68_10465 [Flavobacteriaceae bacterium]|nr:hypothetical protein [Flavobacteriaceae bacterium]
MATIKLVCLGDSLTEGYGILPKDCWVNLLANQLNIEIVNSGISGDTTGGMLSRFQRMVLDHEPTHVMIMGGTNDLYCGLPHNLILANILSITRQARYHNIEPIIAIPTDVLTPEIDITIYQDALRDFATEDDQQLIDFSSKLSPDCFLEDGLHPNEKGHIVMTKLVEGKLMNLL